MERGVIKVSITQLKNPKFQVHSSVLTNEEMVGEVVAIFHLEGMDIPEDEQAELLNHLEQGTLGRYVEKILADSRCENEWV